MIAYLARADIALSVTMTACSTVLGILLTPLLIWGLGGAYLPVDAWAMLLSVLKIVLVPVAAGLVLHVWLKERLDRVIEIFPAVSVVIIVLIIASIVGLTRDKLSAVVGVLGVVVVLHNIFGLAFGYGIATLFRLPEAARRTVAIEVGMQNSGLGVGLALTHFNATVALPSSLFSVVHNLIGSGLARWWGRAGD